MLTPCAVTTGRRSFFLVGVLAVMTAAMLPGTVALAAQAPVGLGTARSFAVLAGSAVTNVPSAGTNLVGRDLGVSPGTAVTGFPPGIVGGATHKADATALQAQQDATTAFDDAAGRTASGANSGLTDLVGKNLQPGVYQGNALSLSGVVTLDNNNDKDAVFIFQAASTLITSSSSVVTFTNADGPSCNVFWEVGSSATLGTNSSFVGTLVARASVSANTGATVQGRLIARTAAVTLDDNVITPLNCTPVVVTTPPTTSPVTTPPVTKPPVTTPPVTTPPVTKPPVTKPPVITRPTTIPPPHDTISSGTVPIITIPIGSSTNTVPRTGTSTRATGTQRTAGTTTRPTTTRPTTHTSATSTNGIDTGGTQVSDTGRTTSSSTQAIGIDTGSGQLASTGPPVNPLVLTGSLALLVGGALLLFARGGRTQPGRHRRAAR